MRDKTLVLKNLYLLGIILNFIWIFLMAGMITAILNHCSTESVLQSMEWKICATVSSLGSMLLFVYNIRITARQSQEQFVILLLGNLFINPFISISILKKRFVSQKTDEIMSPKDNVYVRKTVYQCGIVLNFIWIALIAEWGIAVYNDWAVESYIGSILWKIGILISTLASLVLLLYNLRLIVSRSRILKMVLFSGNLFINPFMSVSFLKNGLDPEKPLSNQEIDCKTVLRKLYKAGNWINVFFLCYFIMMILMYLIYKPLGELMSVPFPIIMGVGGIAAAIIYNVNYYISKIKDTPGSTIMVILGFFIYTPFYSRKVLRKGWI